MTALHLDNVDIKLHGETLLTVDAVVNAGDVLTLMGPSGCGKSSLLAYIGGFLDPIFEARGDVRLGDEQLTKLQPHERRTGFLFQDPLLFPHMSVGENLLFAIPADTPRQDRRPLAEESLSRAGLEGFFDRDPGTLSGGQKARVALMRVLLSKPRALLLDEPFSKLDTELRTQIRTFVFDEARRQNLPIVLVTHDQADADATDGRVIHLDLVK